MTIKELTNRPDTSTFDVVILGGGAAGLMCALTAGQRGKKVLLLEVSNKLGKKILMSGGGRCNFTNLEVLPEHYICSNPHFVKSALKQFTQWDFIAMIARHEVAYHEKSQGQLFCDKSAKDVLKLLVDECGLGKVETRLNCITERIEFNPGQEKYFVETNLGNFSCTSLVVATGGLSIPTLGGATGLGYKIARQFKLEVSVREPSLVPFTLTGMWLDVAKNLAGVALSVDVSVPAKSFREGMLFTHRGLSGPAILQLSNYWYSGDTISIDLLPGCCLEGELLDSKQSFPKATLTSTLSRLMPKSVAGALVSSWWPELQTTSLQGLKNSTLSQIAYQMHHWRLTPSGTEGYRTAEVTRGGVNVSQISSKTMEVNNASRLFIVGEVLDVTGHLGGYNFQWAWSSGYVAGINV